VQGSSRPRGNRLYDGPTSSGAEAYGNWADDAVNVVNFDQYGQSEIPFAGDDDRPTVGSVVDQFMALSPDDRQAFLMLIGGMGYVVPIGTNVVPRQVRRSAASASAIPVVTPGPGYTQDPVTGKIYRAQPPKQRSDEWVALEEEYSEARSELADVMTANKFTYNVKTSEILDENQQTVDETIQPERLKQSRLRLKAAKDRLKEYKELHPEEFRKDTGKSRKQGTPAKIVPTIGIERPPKKGGTGKSPAQAKA
jgi:hypothetical protein